MLEAAAVLPAARQGITWRTRATQPGSAKHILALADEPWAIRPHELESEVPPWVLPVQVDGPTPFTMLAVHTFAAGGQPSYPAQVAAVIDLILPAVTGDAVVAGDFNTPIMSSLAAHLRNDEALQTRGLCSAFLASRETTAAGAYGGGGKQGSAWREPTYYRHRRRAEGFHIDHVYAPTSWMTPVPRVAVGSYEEWVEPGRSDHAPVQVDFASVAATA